MPCTSRALAEPRMIFFFFFFLDSRYFRATSTYTTKTHGLGRPNCLLEIEIWNIGIICSQRKWYSF